MAQLQQVLGEEAIIATDVGQHQMHTAQYYPFTRPRSFISSCGLGTMGYGMGAAVGAQTGNPARRVALITGDGSFHMNMSEMATAVTEGLPILVLVMNNGVLGMVRQWQSMFYEKRYSQTDLLEDVDFCKIAQGFGLPAVRLTRGGEVENALRKALAAEGPAFIECMVDHDEKVLPMVAPGDSIDRLMLAVDS